MVSKIYCLLNKNVNTKRQRTEQKLGYVSTLIQLERKEAFENWWCLNTQESNLQKIR